MVEEVDVGVDGEIHSHEESYDAEYPVIHTYILLCDNRDLGIIWAQVDSWRG